MAMNDSDISGKYRHYKGNEYDVIGAGIDTETEARVVVYKSLTAPFTIWVRPYDMFFEVVTVEGQEVARFEKLA